MTTPSPCCRICGNAAGNTPYVVREMMFGTREPFDYFQCGGCGCLQISQVPDDLARHYPPGYNGHVAPRHGAYRGLRGRVRRWRREATLLAANPWQRWLRQRSPARAYAVLGRLPLTYGTRILDVGSGGGSFLYHLYELGMHQTRGTDPFIDAPITYPNGFRVDKKSIHEQTGNWDVIIYNHAFEHVAAPLDELRAVHARLAAGGTCVLRIPTVSSYAWEHYRTHWFQLDAPRHLYLHSVDSVRRLAEAAGLQPGEVVYDSTAQQFIHSEQYARDEPLYVRLPFWQRKVQRWKYAPRAQRLNQQGRGDQAAFFLHKRP